MVLVCAACGPVENEYSVDEATYPMVTTFEVADSSFRESIRLHIRADIGPTSAYTLDKIAWGRRDSLFAVSVIGRHKESSKDVPYLDDRKLDTIVILQTPRLGMHYFLLDPRNGNFSDSTLVY